MHSTLSGDNDSHIMNNPCSFLYVSDPVVKLRAQKYLFCSPDDTETLKDAITKDDLAGVEEIIVKTHNSPKQSPKKSPLKKSSLPVSSVPTAIPVSASRYKGTDPENRHRIQLTTVPPLSVCAPCNSNS